MRTPTPTTMDQITAEKMKISQQLARLNADREKIATQLADLETAELEMTSGPASQLDDLVTAELEMTTVADLETVELEMTSGATSIDTGIVLPNGKAYFFRGSEYLRYDVATHRVDPGYPLPIAGHWSGFPAHFTRGIDFAVVWNNGKAYFFRGNEYVQYDVNTHRVDAGYPKPTENWFGRIGW